MHRRLVTALVVVLGLALAPEALATIEGPCEAIIAGEDVVARDTFARSDAISVPQTGAVPVTMTAERADRPPEARDRVRRNPLRGQRRADDRQLDDRCRSGRRLREVRHRSLQDRRDEHRARASRASPPRWSTCRAPARDGRRGDRDRDGDRRRSRRLLVRAPRRSSRPRDAALDVPRGHPRRRDRRLAPAVRALLPDADRDDPRPDRRRGARLSRRASSAPAATSRADVGPGTRPGGEQRRDGSAFEYRHDHPAPSADEDTTIMAIDKWTFRESSRYGRGEELRALTRTITRFEEAHMAGKADFTEDEWKELQQGVTGAGMLVSTAHRDFTDAFGEASAVAKQLAAHRESESQLVRELSETRGTGFGLVSSPKEVVEGTISALGPRWRCSARRRRTSSRPIAARARRREVGGRGQRGSEGRGNSGDREDHGRARGRLEPPRGGNLPEGDYALNVAFTTRERAEDAREAKLLHIREQVSSGDLVIRGMTKAERAKWSKQRAKLEANWTPEERGRRDDALRNRRRRSERNA